MNRREFLKSIGLVSGGVLLSPLINIELLSKEQLANLADVVSVESEEVHPYYLTYDSGPQTGYHITKTNGDYHFFWKPEHIEEMKRMYGDITLIATPRQPEQLGNFKPFGGTKPGDVWL